MSEPVERTDVLEQFQIFVLALEVHAIDHHSFLYHVLSP